MPLSDEAWAVVEVHPRQDLCSDELVCSVGGIGAARNVVGQLGLPTYRKPVTRQSLTQLCRNGKQQGQHSRQPSSPTSQWRAAAAASAQLLSVSP